MFKNLCRPTNILIRKTTHSPASSSTAAATATTTTRHLTTAHVHQRLTTQQQQQHHHQQQQLTTDQLLHRKPQTVFTSLGRTMSGDSTASVKDMGQVAGVPKHTNRLITAKSPYLLQHAHNPVDWYPWCEEALEKARAEGKMIFLSVGYSTCHWCHVMERESFEQEDVAEIMNNNFVCIKVDREERPDIDQIYMQYLVSKNGGGGGWPMSVWLTPDLAPIMAGTYFPPKNRWGMPSFKNVLALVARRWETNREQLSAAGQGVITSMKLAMAEQANAEPYEPGSLESRLDDVMAVLLERYDMHNGGFGTKPKFPEVSRLNFLMHMVVVKKHPQLLDMVWRTLSSIGSGGIYDHVFGGFSRYAVDASWHVPHFEKMLYDQGQLMGAYAHASKLTNDKTMLSYADGIYQYIMKDLRHPLGGFFSGEDADSLPSPGATEKVEGAFYVWTLEEIRNAVLKNPHLYGDTPVETAFDMYCHLYDVREQGNVSYSNDPHKHFTYKNILIVRGCLQDTASRFQIPSVELRKIVQATNETLRQIREQRPRPHLDTKIICSWNGLMLSGLAKAANCRSAKREEYLKTARELVDFLHKHMYDAEKKVLLRSRYGHSTTDETLDPLTDDRLEGFLVDYAFLVRGLLDYYKSTLSSWALHWAKELQDTQDRLFWDSTNGGYFNSQADAPDIIVRMKDDHDGAEPSGNSVSARNLILLGHYFDDESYKERADKIFKYFNSLQRLDHTMPEMLSALMLHEFGLDSVAVVGPKSEETDRFFEIFRKYYIPGMVVQRVDPQNPDETVNKRIEEKFKIVNGKPTVYICHDKVCRMPITDPEKLNEYLKESFFDITEEE